MNTLIPNSVWQIGDNAFRNCTGLIAIDIPNSVTIISKGAFDCKNLTSVTVRKEKPIAISNSSFSNSANATLYVPYGCKTAYEAAPYWKNFKEIVELPEDSGIDTLTMQMDGTEQIFDANGRRIQKLQRGVNIIRMKDGTTQKVVVK